MGARVLYIVETSEGSGVEGRPLVSLGCRMATDKERTTVLC